MTTPLAKTRRRTARAGAVLLASLAAAGAAACSPPGEGGRATQDQVAPASVSTDIGEEPIELTLYDGAGLKAVDEALIEAFTAKHPNVTITTRFDPDDVQAQNAPRVLASDDPPDIARIIALGDIVGNGQLTKLDAWAQAYGWEIPEGQLAMYRVDDNGVRGAGAQYTVASGFVVTGLYYNKEIAERVGMGEPPTTIVELEEDLAAAKQAGVVPIMAGNQTGQLIFTVQMLLNDALGQQALNDWVFNAPGATIDTSEAADAVGTVANWVEAGYFPADTNGTDSTAALGRFARGEALFYPSGNWDAAALEEQMGDNVGFVLPPSSDGTSSLAMSDPVSNFAIPAKSDAKDAAAAFLDFLTSEEARQVMVDAGFAPSGEGDAPTTEPGSLNAEVQAAFADLVEADGQVQFVQNATSGINATWLAQTQLLAGGGRTSPADLLTAVQAKYDEELGR
ncbi:ABC transporter substrate-binding protein [Nocardioides gansuensis]|uniref:ABC transporter substrate-binding protein n=1 Tax=Nocardioides gansuensis TaxID=2138300 RepID=A0A2T8F6G3_9ACTN|nr:extracellular solute-binding protein [Nocardioides gansuensis]PVG81301.1 ABC transporter substrate-binding protein [Nocardioides gansuensis]